MKVDIARDPHPPVDNVETVDEIRMLSLRDIGAMKMYAIHGDGGRLKDFADIHKLLEKNPFDTYLKYTIQKYPEVEQDRLKKLLILQPEVDLDSRIHFLGKPIEWHEVTDRLRLAFRQPGKIFNNTAQLKEEKTAQKPPRHRRCLRPG